jgi:fatty-acyl-CoA synthase
VPQAVAPPYAPTVGHLLGRAFRRFSSNPCLVWERGSASFSQTQDRVAKLATWLSANSRANRHVAIALPNGRAYVESMLACALGGVVRLQLGPREPIEVIRTKLVESQAEILICEPDMADQLADWIRDTSAAVLVSGGFGPEFARYDDVVTRPAPAGRLPAGLESDRYRLSFTGGTTGAPKGVVLAHRQEQAMMRNLLMEAFQPGPGCAFVAATPLAHAAGAFVVPTLLQGGAVAWLPRFDPSRIVDATWLADGSHKWSLETFVVPTALADVAAAVHGDHDLRTVVYGGAPCSDAVLNAAIDNLGPDTLVQVYGQAEAPMTISVASRADHAAGLVTDGWVGYPFLFVDVQIDAGATEDAEVGEVVVYGEHVMDGYWNRPEESAERVDEDHGLHTGDVGRLDERGGLRIVGRAREMVISGGHNVYPDDVERRLRQHGLNGMQFSVFGVPHERWGEAVVVAAVRDVTVDEATQRDRLAAAAESMLAYYERPKEVLLVDALPLTVVGKISRQELTVTYADRFGGADV